MQLLVKDPSRRMTLDDVLKHVWIKKNFLDTLDDFQRSRFEFSLRKSERKHRRPLAQLHGAPHQHLVNSATSAADPSSSSTSETSAFAFGGDTPARVGPMYSSSASASDSSSFSSSSSGAAAPQPYRPTAHAKQNEEIIMEEVESDSDSDSDFVPRDGPPLDWQKHDDAGYATGGGAEPMQF